ncbi:hypothetical protein Tco_1207657 [Tanacetum coccineum]
MSTKPQRELDGSTLKVANILHDLRTATPVSFQILRVVVVYTISSLHQQRLEYLRGVCQASTLLQERAKLQINRHISRIEDLVPNSMWSQTVVKYDKFALWGISHWGKKRRQFYAFATLRESARDVYSKRRIIAVTKVEIVEWHDYKHLDWITVRGMMMLSTSSKKAINRLRIQDLKIVLLLVQGKSD